MSTPSERIIVGDALDPSAGELCGCGGASDVAPPSAPENAPALPAIAYRVGTYATFRQGLLAGLSALTHPQFERLRTRENSDFTVALLDAWATVGDVLTFYQERIANEQYLRTATDRASIVELARLIGYRLRPGVAASTLLAFTLDDARLDKNVPFRALTIDKGARVQSVPGPGEQAQTFESIDRIQAHPDWNVLRPEQSRRHLPQAHDVELHLQGITSNLRVGDALLLVGDERLAQPQDNHWDFRRVTAVEPDTKRGLTRITWQRGLGSIAPRMPPARNPRVYALRTRASLFGFNAPHPQLLHPQLWPALTGQFTVVSGVPGDWHFAISTENDPNDRLDPIHAIIELDGVHAGVAEQSWLVLSRPLYQELYRVNKVTEAATARYGMSGKRTVATADTAVNLKGFADEYRDTAVFAQSEELQLAEIPVTEPVAGATLVLDRVIEPLEADRVLICRGRRPRVGVLTQGLQFVSDVPGGRTRALDKNTELFLTAAPLPEANGSSLWPVRTEGGEDGALHGVPGTDVRVLPARETDPTAVESVIVRSCTAGEDLKTQIGLRQALTQAYDRTSLEIFANVARATHGETVSEIPGSGDNRLTHQTFALKQVPLTYVRAPNGSGATSTLEVRVDEIAWHEVDHQLDTLPNERTYTTRHTDDAGTVIEFGDGRHGQRLGSGRDNVRARYRKGIGIAGQVRAGQLTTPLQVPLGVRSVSNPLPASGAADAELMGAAKRNAPMTVTTLDRTVSLRDYADFAATFAGLEKAAAMWVWDGLSRRIFISVAASEGAVADADLLRDLVTALRDAGQPTVVFEVATFSAVYFRVKLRVKVATDYVQESVLAAVEAALRTTFSFAQREFAQAVALSELVTVVQNVAGVVAVDVDALWRTSPPADTPVLNARLPAFGPRRGADGRMRGAEILLLDAAPIASLGVMP